MKCPHCMVVFHEEPSDWGFVEIEAEEEGRSAWVCMAIACLDCNELIVKVAKRLPERMAYPLVPFKHLPISETVFPTSQRHEPISEEVPIGFKLDFTEARDVLPISPKASAALSRRILQSVLNEQGYSSRDLVKQIEAALSEKDLERALPYTLRRRIDAVRNFGNFSAHPMTDATTLQIIDVEPEEAEWCLQIIQDLFDYYYVQAAEDRRKLASLNEKLQQAGKPPARS